MFQSKDTGWQMDFWNKTHLEAPGWLSPLKHPSWFLLRLWSHDLSVMRASPESSSIPGLEPVWDSVSLSLPPLFMLTLYLFWGKGWGKDPSVCCYKRLTLDLKTHEDWKWRARKNIHYANRNTHTHTQAKVTILTSDKRDFKQRLTYIIS